MIAMAIINDPDLIIADEPTTALDVTVQAQILETLLAVRDETGAAIMMITHDLGVVAGIAARVQVMYGGTVVESGPVTDIFDRPRMPYTVGLLGLGAQPGAARQAAAPRSTAHRRRCCGCRPAARSGPAARWSSRSAGRPSRSWCRRRTGSTLARCRRWAAVTELESPQRMFLRPEMHHADGTSPVPTRSTGRRRGGPDQ